MKMIRLVRSELLSGADRRTVLYCRRLAAHFPALKAQLAREHRRKIESDMDAQMPIVSRFVLFVFTKETGFRLRDTTK